MICSNCGEQGHNKLNKNCPRNLINQNLSNLYGFSQGPLYYLSSLNYITKIYPEVLCISLSDIRWTGSFKILKDDLSKALSQRKQCPYDFIFYNLRVTRQGISHANSILINTKNGNFSRYEPHGFSESWGNLDVNLSKVAQINNVIYEPPAVSCLFYGIQTSMNDNIGLCQTAVLYNLLSKLDKKYDYRDTILSTKKSKSAIFSLMTDLLLNIYNKLPNELKSVFLGYSTLNIFQKETINQAIIITQT